MKHVIWWRFRFTQFALLFAGLAIIFQIIFVQNNPESKNWLKIGSTYEGSWKNVFPERGRIYDRDGKLLATNQPTYEVGVELARVSDAEAADEIARAIEAKLGLDYITVMSKISNQPEDVNYVLLEKFSPYSKVQEFLAYRDSDELQGTLTAWNLEAVYFVPHMVRSYPEKTLAANILGLITLNDERSYGIEEFYDSLLSGSSERQWIPANPNEAQKMPATPSSTTLILTIDRDIQFATEQILDEAIDEYGAESGVVVVADPKTGEILAMASYPRLDPNEYWEYAMVQGELPYNASVSRAYEPGSVIKILTMAAALDAGVVTPESTYNDVTGYYEVGGFWVENWNDMPWGLQDMTGCLEHSLNVCLAWVAAERLGQEKFYDYMQAFGLGHLTGIDLAEEEPGRLKLPADTDWKLMELGINAYGQGVSVTPIQMIMAASAIANQGQMARPHILRSTVQDGIQHDMPIEIVGNPISSTTAETLEQMLVRSVNGETSLAGVNGYTLAGKTGTGTIQTEYTELTNASFVGWGPVDDPEFIIYVWLEKPTESIWGSETAAPVFKQVAQKVILLMGIPPDQVRLGLTGH